MVALVQLAPRSSKLLRAIADGSCMDAIRPERNAAFPPSGVGLRWIGALFLVHFALLAALKIGRGLSGEVLWISHAGLLLGGFGMLLSSRTLVATAFTAVAALHAAWMVDALGGVVFGWFPLGLTTYLLDADPLAIAATSHHLYLAPMLGWLLLREGGFPVSSCVGALALIIVVTALSRAAVSPSLNVNFAHAVLPASTAEAFVWFNRQPAWIYLPIHAAVCFAGAFVPAAVAMRLLIGIRTRFTPLLESSRNAFQSESSRIHAH